MNRGGFAPARPEAVIDCGGAGQNAASVAALLDCLARGLPIHASLDGIRPDAAAGDWLCCQSSGSGGRVKTIRRSQRSWLASFAVSCDHFGLSSGDCHAVLGQLGHSLALYAAIEALQLGARLMVLAGDSPRRQRAALGRATVIYATPAQLRRLLLGGPGDLPGVTHVFCGGGKLDPVCRAGIAALCPNAAIREFYGASETSFIAIADDETPPGSVGRAYPGVDLRLDAAGRIGVRSPYVFQGYAEPDLPPLACPGGYLQPGDIGRLDAQGNLFLRGREARMVTVADCNLFLEDVEAVLAAQVAAPSAALALPDALRGHAVVAVIEGAPDDALAARLRRACRQALGDHAAPRRVVFVPRLPLLGSDKPDLVALARLVAP